MGDVETAAGVEEGKLQAPIFGLEEGLADVADGQGDAGGDAEFAAKEGFFVTVSGEEENVPTAFVCDRIANVLFGFQGRPIGLADDAVDFGHALELFLDQSQICLEVLATIVADDGKDAIASAPGSNGFVANRGRGASKANGPWIDHARSHFPGFPG